ncbi:ion transporter [Bremerella sp. JC770]|uniref:ion transporter n=1 Tax=Bremerella sp. JC770 TaxID=3232137 RepID=UPI0034578363
MNSHSPETEGRSPLLKKLIDLIDRLVVPLVWYSVVMLAIECQFYPDDDSYDTPQFFLWSERIVALIFTVEYVVRLLRNSGRGFYPITALGVIDLISIVPFWIGFIPALDPYLRLVRTLRVLRMLKFFRYSRGLQLMALGFYRSYWNLRPLMLATLMMILFTMFALYEVEGMHQDEFRSLFTVAWFLEVTGTTVGYGDLSPQSNAGKVIVMVYMIGGLAIFMACFSAITSSFDQVFKEAADPEFDPLDQFDRIREEQEELEEQFRDTGSSDSEDEAAEEEQLETEEENSDESKQVSV